LRISQPIFDFTKKSSKNQDVGPKVDPTVEVASFRSLY